MAEDIIVGLVTVAVDRVAVPIKRQFNYLRYFTTNIANLENEAEKLQATGEDLQANVNRVTNGVRDISHKVDNWFQRSNNVKIEMDEILEEVQNVGSGCLKLRARFSLSKRAMKTTDLMKELQNECTNFNDDNIALPSRPPAQGAIPLETTYEFESRKQIEQELMETLELGNVNMIGIYGMGGLGKTTMAKRVANRALENHVFKEVVFAVVSRPVDKLKLQVDIGTSLGLSDLKDEKSEVIVAQRLRVRLSGQERILLVLDDVWETLVLEDLGIPCNHKGCTILLTSQNRDALSGTDDKNVFEIQVLSEDDAWILFRNKAGTCVDDNKLNSTAKEVVNECKGLPIALATVGAALRNVMNERIWEDTLRQFKQSDPDIPALIANVYTPLKLSYDSLGPKHKLVFLLCCLYPEDTHIPLERLTYFCLGLGLFERGIINVEEARNNLQASAYMLKNRSLLLDSKYGDRFVRMHDVVRDVCIFIAKQERKIGGIDCSWISSFHKHEFPTDLEVSNLRLLLWDDNSANEKLKPDARFLKGISDLHVLCIDNNNLLTSLSLATRSLKNLKTLVLYSCSGLEALSGIGELVNLEILNCWGCGSIKELPREMEGLNRLKLLDLSYCRGLQRIEGGIISSLVALEELKMLYSFKRWETKDSEERENASVRELEALANLRHLEIEILDSALAVENMRLSSKIDKFDIRFLGNEIRNFGLFDHIGSNKKMHLVLREENHIGDWIEMQLLKNTECLDLEGSGAGKVDLTKLKNIQYLVLSECKSMEKIVTYTMDDCGGATWFSHIEYLMLRQLGGLQVIWDGQISSIYYKNLKILILQSLPALTQVWKGSSRAIDYENDENRIQSPNSHHITTKIFPKLETLHLKSLPALNHVWEGSFRGMGDLFPQLEFLSIESGKMMKQVFLSEAEDVNEENSIQSPNSHHLTTKILPKLKELSLIEIPNLTSLCKGIQGIEFPQLRTLEIYMCDEMEIMVSKAKESNENNSGSSSSNEAQIQDHRCQMSFGCLKELRTDWKPFYGRKIDVSLFHGLEELRISFYEGNTSLFMSSIAKNLFNLKVLRLEDCDKMVQVIEEDDDEEKLENGGEKTFLFPKLLELELSNLSKLVSFCNWNCDVELTSLRELHIKGCNEMEYFTFGNIDTPNLKRFCIDYVDLGVEKDLNEMLQEHHSTRPKETGETTMTEEEAEAAATALINQLFDKHGQTQTRKFHIGLVALLFVSMLCFFFVSSAYIIPRFQ